ncbi:MAG: hypothetical protein QME14_00730 [Methanobacteriaceae archaeon]|nr:hypothetical protein [Methanobacteriaceae archaeon]
MDEKCYVCGRPAVGQCKVCYRFFCERHGSNGFCDEDFFGSGMFEY